jgi:hypothetical protein
LRSMLRNYKGDGCPLHDLGETVCFVRDEACLYLYIT